jgi:hypothetical protein
MHELLIAGGILWLAALATWSLGPFMLRAAALGCFTFAGVLLLLAGTEKDISPGAGPALACVGAALWTLGHVLYRLRYGRWATRLAGWLFSGCLPSHRRRDDPAARRAFDVKQGRARSR